MLFKKERVENTGSMYYSRREKDFLFLENHFWQYWSFLYVNSSLKVCDPSKLCDFVMYQLLGLSIMNFQFLKIKNCYQIMLLQRRGQVIFHL